MRTRPVKYVYTDCIVVLEVERAANLVRKVALGKKIVRVDVLEDNIVFSGVSHDEFVSGIDDLILHESMTEET